MSHQAAAPYHLRPKASNLAEGPDVSLEPSEAPTDATERMRAPFVWSRSDTSSGGAGPPDPPLAPPGTDPARRTAPPFAWPRTAPDGPTAALDPDIALWPQVIVSMWPFTGPPTEGIWPLGWLGIDNTGTVWVCRDAGEPGTWGPLAAGTGLASLAGTLSSGHTVTDATVTVLTTETLAPGLWLVLFSGVFAVAQSSAQDVVVQMTEGTATATITGPRSTAAADANASVSEEAIFPLAISTHVTVTAAGELAFTATSSASGTAGGTIDGTPFTGWTAVPLPS